VGACAEFGGHVFRPLVGGMLLHLFEDKHGVFPLISKLIEQFDVLKYRGPVKTEQCYQTS
jgi:hypothetical protein